MQAEQTRDLQFDRADFGESGTPALACTGCKRQVTDTYYAAGQKIICPACRDALQRAMTGGSGTKRLVRAILFGVPAAVLGSAIYYGVEKLTGYQFGLVAIVIGVLVGSAVRRGEGGRGGLVYQLLAVALTYVSIASTNLPYILQALRNEHDAAQDTVTKTVPDVRPGDSSPAVHPATVVAPAAAEAPREVSATGVAFALLALFAFTLAAPFLAGMQNIVGLFIIGIGLYEAWKLNRPLGLQMTGPHQLGAGEPAAAPVR